MKVRTFRKCVNRRKAYKTFPMYTTQIKGIGLGEDTRYIYNKMLAYRDNGRWVFRLYNSARKAKWCCDIKNY